LKARPRSLRELRYGEFRFSITHRYSFGTESGDGICFGGAERGQQGGEQADYGQDKSDPDENKWIVGFRSEEERLHQTRDARGGQ
jgi:hypothetical protein